jgi:hypothetical protein
MPNLPWTHNTVCSLTLIGVASTSQIVNVFHFEASGVKEATFIDDNERVDWANDLADDFVTNMKAPWLTVHSSDYTLQMVRTQVLEVEGAFRHKLTAIERAQTTLNVGTAGAAADDPILCFVTKWRTPIAGKSHRGRSYIGPLTPTWVSAGRLSTPGNTAATNFVASFIGRYAVTGSQAASQIATVYSRPYNSGEYQYATRKTGTLTVVTPPDYAGNSTNITAGTVDTILRVQRRREIGVGS